MILNGDIEELQRFRAADVRRRWSLLFELFDAFAKTGGLHRLEGNHDLGLGLRGELDAAFRLRYGEDPLLVLHRHQAAVMYERFNDAVGFFLRTIATPLRIHNRSVAHSSIKRFVIERRV